MNELDSFFVAGGTLPLDASSYVTRDADVILLEALRRGEYCYVLNTRQMGKSSLMVRTAQRLQQEGIAVAVLDLSAIGRNMEIDQWYFGMLRRIARPLGLAAEVDSFWRDNRQLGPMQRWLEAIHQIVLPHLEHRQASGTGGNGRLVLFVDEIDFVRSLPFSPDEFLAGIRSCYNRRTEDTLFSRVTFCLLGVAAPADLIRDVHLSPFNIGRRIELTDFSLREATPLSVGLQQALGRRPAGQSVTGQQLLERILYWTHGHPYMTQRLCVAVLEEIEAHQGKCAGTLLVDDVCSKLFLTKDGENTDDNLAFARNRLLRSDCDIAALLDLYLRIRNGRRVRDDETNPLCSILRLAGVVRATGGELVIRNRIYHQVFDREWVHTHMPDAELRRQRAAYRRGILRTAAVSLVAVSVVGTLAVVAGIQAARATRATRVSNANLLTARRQATQIEGLNRALQAALDRQRTTNGLLSAALKQARTQEDRARHEAHNAETARGVAVAREKDAQRASKVAQQQHTLAVARLRRLNLDTGIRRMTDGDLLGSLPFLTEALRLDGGGSREMLHRVRIAAILRRAPQLTRIWFSNSGVTSAAFDHEGKHVVTTDRSGLTRMLDAESGQEIWSKPGGVSALTATFSPDGRNVGIGYADGSARVYTAGTGAPLSPVLRDVSETEIGNGTYLSWSRDSRMLSIAAGDEVTVWDLQPVRIQCRVRLPETAMFGSDFSPDGKLLAVAIDRDPACIIDIATGAVCTRLRQCFDAYHVEFSPDGLSVLATGIDSAARYQSTGLFDVRTGLQTRFLDLPATTYGTLFLKFSPSGNEIAAAIDSIEPVRHRRIASLYVFNAANGSQLCRPIELGARIRDMQFSPNGATLVAAADDGSITAWNVHTGKRATASLHHAGPVNTAAFSPDGASILSAGDDRTTRVWRLPTDSPRMVSFPDTSLGTIDLMHGARLLLQTSRPDEVRLVDTARGTTIARIDGRIGRTSDDEKRFGIEDRGAFRVFDTWTGTEIVHHPLPPGARGETVPYLCRDGQHYLLVHNGFVQVFLVANGRAVSKPVSLAPDEDIHLVDDRRTLLSGGSKQVRLWDLSTGKVSATANAPQGSIDRTARIAGTRLLLTRTGAAMAILWNIGGGRQPVPVRLIRSGSGIEADARIWLTEGVSTTIMAPLTARMRALNASMPVHGRRERDLPAMLNLQLEDGTAFRSADGRLLIVSGSTMHAVQTVEILDASSGRRITLLPHATALWQAAFSSDNRRVATVDSAGNACVWNTATGVPLTPAMNIGAHVEEIIFSPDGLKLATREVEGHFSIWDAGTGEPLTPEYDLHARLIRFTPDSTSLLVVGEGRLEQISFTPETQPLGDLVRTADLLTGAHVASEGNLASLNPGEIAAEWTSLQRSHRFDHANHTVSAPIVAPAPATPAGQSTVITEMRTMARMRNALEPTDTDSASWLRLAQQAAVHAQWHETVSAADEALKYDVSVPSTWYMRGIAHLFLNQDDLASQDFSAMVGHGGDAWLATDAQARFYRMRGEWRKTAEAYATTDRRQDGDTRTGAATCEASAWLQAGMQAGYRSACTRMWALLRSTSDRDLEMILLLTLAASPNALSDPAQLETAAEQALSKFPGAEDIASAAGCVMMRAGRYAEAARLLRAAPPTFGLELSATAGLCLAMAEWHLGQHDAAISEIGSAGQLAERYLGATRDFAGNDGVWACRTRLEMLSKEAAKLIQAPGKGR
jgi:WD40 repeat protein